MLLCELGCVLRSPKLVISENFKIVKETIVWLKLYVIGN